MLVMAVEEVSIAQINVCIRFHSRGLFFVSLAECLTGQLVSKNMQTQRDWRKRTWGRGPRMKGWWVRRGSGDR